MDKFIKVYDNLVSLPIQSYIEDYITSEIPNRHPFPLFYNPQLTNQDSDKDVGFANLFYEFKKTVTKESSLLLSPLYSLTLSQNIALDSIILGRVFLQTITPNFGPQNPHIDTKEPHLVCLYYVNDSDGDTIFYDDSKNEIKRVSPKKGRIAFFDGSIYHAGSKPKDNTRIVINICFKGNFLN